MTALFTDRTPREKRLLAALAATLLLWLVATQVWVPLQAMRQGMADRIPRIERALAMVHQTPVSATGQGTDPRPLAVVVTEAAGPFGLNISRLQPRGAAVELALEDATFDAVLLWIEALERDNGLRLADLTLTRRPAPGIVGATLTLER